MAAGIVDSSGNVLQSGTVELYEAGTSTPVTGYSDAALTSSLGSTITLSSRGSKLIFVDGTVDLKLVIKDSGGSTIDTMDGLDYSSGAFSFIESDPELLLQNTDQEDNDGGRQSTIRHKGVQSGGEVSTLATVVASHDGAVDDQKGKYTISVNDGNDNDSPSAAYVLASGALTIPGTISTGGDATVNGNIVVTGTVDGVDVATLNTNYTNHAAETSIHFAKSSVAFLDLSDTPGTFTASNYTRVNAGGTAIEYRTAANVASDIQGSVDHGSVSGLLDDDHTQYSLADGTRAFTGQVTITSGGMDITGNVGIGISSGDGTLHVHTATAGSVTALTTADDLVVENSAQAGISILSGSGSEGRLTFGSGASNDLAEVRCDTSTGNLVLRGKSTSGRVNIGSADATYALGIPEGKSIIFSGGTTRTGSGLTDPTGSSEIATKNYVDIQVSDSSLKDNIETVQNPIDIVKSLRGVSFDWNDKAQDKRELDDKHDYGFIAQEVQSVFPELIGKRVYAGEEDSTEYLAIKSGNAFNAILIEAVKEIASRLETLENA